MGTAEFEVELISYDFAEWRESLKLGVMRCKTGSKINQKDIPCYTPGCTHHCVWSSDRVHKRLTDSYVEQCYGIVNLDELRAGDRVGMCITYDGNLELFVNGRHQGIAAEGIYQRGYDVYAVVDHCGNCKATKITRAGGTCLVIHYFPLLSSPIHISHTAAISADLRLQDICLRQIASWMNSQRDI